VCESGDHPPAGTTAQELLEGGGDTGAAEALLLVEEDPRRAALRIEAELRPETVVVFEGRGPDHALKLLRPGPFHRVPS